MEVAVSRLLPFSYLHEALMGALGAPAAMPAWQAALGGGCWLVAAAGLAWLVGRRLIEAD